MPLAAGNGAVEETVPTPAGGLAPVRVNAVSPGVIDTPWSSAIPIEQRRALVAASAERTAVGRIGPPEDVPCAILALIQSEYVSGTVLACTAHCGSHDPVPARDRADRRTMASQAVRTRRRR